MGYQKNLKIPSTTYDKALDKAVLILIIIFWLMTLLAWFKLPATIPMHFNLHGKIDRYGSKITLLLFPLVASLVIWLLTFLNKRPRMFNYPVIIHEENIERQYLYATRLIRFLKLAIAVLCIMIILITYRAATGGEKGPGIWFVFFIFGLFNIPTIYYIIKSFKAT